MRASLEGPRLKLHRAGEHLDYLDSLTSPFIKAELDRITVEYDAHAGCKVFWLDPRPTPPDWGPIVGDILYNCRSSLDQFANRLVEANGHKPDSKTAFPIYRSESDFLSQSRPMIAKMSAGARALIEGAQPYKRPKWPEYHALAVLNELSNEDKHRQLHLTVTSFEGAATYGDIDIAGSNFGPLVDRAPVLAVRVPGPEVDVPLTFFLDIAFAEKRRWKMPVRLYGFFVEVIDLIERLFLDATERGLVSG